MRKRHRQGMARERKNELERKKTSSVLVEVHVLVSFGSNTLSEPSKRLTEQAGQKALTPFNTSQGRVMPQRGESALAEVTHADSVRVCLNKVRALETSAQPLHLVGDVHGHGNMQTLNYPCPSISNQNSHLRETKAMKEETI